MNRRIKIMTDSGSDIPKEQEISLGIRILCFPIMVGEKSFYDRDMTDDDYYRLILDSVKSADFPLTSQVLVHTFEEVYKEYYEEGYTDLIYTAIADKGSATFGNASRARDFFYEENPEAKEKFTIHLIDSGNYTGVYGHPVIVAAKMAEAGETPEKICYFIEEWCKYAEVNFGCYTLDFVKRSGRVSTAAAFVGEMLGLRPIIRIKQAVSTTTAKVRGDKAVIPKVIDIVSERIIPGTPYVLIAGIDKAAEDEMRREATKRLGYPPEMTFYVGAAVAANVGPNVIGIICKCRD
ncbi:MAG: DegV family EDD domain-containing protein [Ruminococcus sp.]|nr:DegV family EDD domain-containing protein [Ruminococcus sp.]